MLVCATFWQRNGHDCKDYFCDEKLPTSILITQQGILLSSVFCFPQQRLEVGYSDHVMAELRIPEEGSKARKRRPWLWRENFNPFNDLLSRVLWEMVQVSCLTFRDYLLWAQQKSFWFCRKSIKGGRMGEEGAHGKTWTLKRKLTEGRRRIMFLRRNAGHCLRMQGWGKEFQSPPGI